LIGVKDLRAYLDEAETEAIIKAREMGAAVEDIAAAIGLTRQGVYYRLKALKPDQAPTVGKMR
jgi:DNA-binding phage protein